jgi:methionyl-tRNA formyltransferase
VTAPPRAAGRGRREAPNPLVERAEGSGIPVLRPESARDAGFQREFASWRPQLGVVVAYGQILDDALLAIPEHGCVNVHGSLLPRWRGASPVQAALLAGDARTGVSVQRVVRELDAGAVLAEREVDIGEREEAPALTARLAEQGADLLADFLREIGEGPLPAGVVQDPGQVTHCRRVRKEEGHLDWGRPAAEIDRRVRAMAGWPVARTRMAEEGLLRVHRGRPDGAAARGGEPGTVLSADADGIRVLCGAGSVYRIEEVQRDGRARMRVADFLRGLPLVPGTLLLAV